jgi:RNA 3'-terminal phosphate cyclase (ATP)
VAKEAAKTANAYLKADAPVGEHLADQLLLPMALGAGGRFVMGKPSTHTLTNIDVIQHFLQIEFTCAQITETCWEIKVA